MAGACVARGPNRYQPGRRPATASAQPVTVGRGVVALPAAPGFFGPYHAACRYALAPLGVPKELALALGTLAHGVFWIGTNLLGLAALRGGTQRLREAMSSAEQEQGTS